MNAKLLERLVAYRETRGLEVAKLLLSQKIRYQFSARGKTSDSASFIQQAASSKIIGALLLVEARAAREYWKRYGASISKTAYWNSRKPYA